MPEPLPGSSGTQTTETRSSGPPLIQPVRATDLSYGAGFFLKALLVSPGGCGKTTGATTAPGRKLFLDTDQGKEVLIGRSDCDIIEIPESDPKSPKAHRFLLEVKKWIEQEVKNGQFQYDSVVLDSITRVYGGALNYVRQIDPARGPGGTPVTTHWLAQKKECQDLIEYFIHAPFHFVATVHEDADKDEVLGTISILPAVTGKDAPWLPSRFGEVYNCFTKSETGKDGKHIITYWWRTGPEPQRPYLGSRMNTDSAFWGPIVEPSFELLMKTRGVWPEPKSEPRKEKENG